MFFAYYMHSKPKYNTFMKRISFAIALFFGSFLTSQAQNQNPNLINNPKFDAGTKSWEIANANGNAIEISNDYKAYGLTDNFAGTYFVELDANSAVQQTIKTEKGKKYVFAFAYSHRPNAGDKQFIVLVNGKPFHTEKIANNAANGGFRQKALSFTAEGETSVVAFHTASLSGEDTQGVLLTDVLVGEESEVNLNLYYSY